MFEFVINLLKNKFKKQSTLEILKVFIFNYIIVFYIKKIALEGI